MGQGEDDWDLETPGIGDFAVKAVVPFDNSPIDNGEVTFVGGAWKNIHG